MTKPEGFQRPSTTRRSETVLYWAQLWRPTEGNAHGEMIVSESFDNEADAVRWIWEHEQEGDELRAWKRIIPSGGGAHRDIPIPLDDEPMADPEQLTRLFGSLSKLIADKKLDLDKSGLGRKGERAALWRPDTTMDARTPMLQYDQVYNEDGTKKLEFGADGWPDFTRGGNTI